VEWGPADEDSGNSAAEPSLMAAQQGSAADVQLPVVQLPAHRHGNSKLSEHSNCNV
jgi:hypothetical protein